MNLAVEIFSTDEHMKCNVKVVLGKEKLDDKRVEYIRQLTFYEYPTASTENE